MRVQSTFGTWPGWGSSSASGGGAFVVKFRVAVWQSGKKMSIICNDKTVDEASRGESCYLQALSDSSFLEWSGFAWNPFVW